MNMEIRKTEERDLPAVLAIYRHRLKKSRRECDETALLDKCRNTLNIKRNVRLNLFDDRTDSALVIRSKIQS